MTVSYYQGTTLLQTSSVVDSPEYDLGWVEFKDGGTGTDPDGGSFTWTMKGDKITVVTEEETMELTITTKEKNRLVVEMSETDTDEGVTYTVKRKLELSRM